MKITAYRLLSTTLFLLILLQACGGKGTVTSIFGDPNQGGAAGGGGTGGGGTTIDDEGNVVVNPVKGVFLTIVGEPVFAEAKGYTVSIYPEMKLEVDGKEYDLFLTGYGLREKKFIIVNADVYIGASYFVKPKTDISGAPLSHLDESLAEVFVMTMVRSVSGDDINDELRATLEVNGFDPDIPEYVPLMEQMAEGAEEGKQIIFVSEREPDSNWERMLVIRPDKPEIDISGEDVAFKIWHAWFGVSVDNHMARLKGDLMAESAND